MKSLRRFRRATLALLVLTLAGAFFLNTGVNPWRVAPRPWTSESLDDHRDIEADFTRTCKAGLIRSSTWNAAIFGSSRVDIGVDPRHPSLAGFRCVNLGLNAGLIYENSTAFDYFMDHSPDPQLVIFFVDAGDLTMPGGGGGPGIADYLNSPFARRGSPVERELGYHFGISAISSSIGVLKRRLRDEPAGHSPEGFRRHAEPLQEPRVQIAGLYLSTILRVARNRTNFQDLDPAKLDLLRHIAARCQKKNTRLVFVLPPNHALFQLAFRELGDPDPWFARDRLAIAEITAEANAARPGAAPVEFLDFQDGHPLNSAPLPLEGQIERWIDIFHFTPEIGGRILDAIAGKDSGYGVKLHPEDVPTRVEGIRRQLENWAADHPENATFLSNSLKAFR